MTTTTTSRDRDNEILAVFMDAIAELGQDSHGVAQYMIELLDDETRPIAVRDTAAYALGAIGFVPALPHLQKHVHRTDNLGKCARRAVGQLDPPTRPTQFCWIHVRSGGNAYGPFDGVDATKADIREHHTGADGALRDGDDLVAIHECDFVYPDSYLFDDLDGVLESMEEALPVPFDAPVYDVYDEKAARADLLAKMRRWTQQHVFVTGEHYTTGRLVVETTVARLLEQE